MTDVASYSSLTAHRQCPAKWSYAYVDRLAKVERVRVELSYGSWWHAVRAADAIERGRASGTLMHVPKSLSTVDDGPRVSTKHADLVTEVLAAADTWWASLPEEDRQPYLDKLHSPVPDNLRRMHAAYLDRWHEEQEQEEVVAVEVRFSRPLRDGVDLVGQVDLVYRDTRRGLLVVRDVKGGKSLSRNMADDLMDSQLHLYAWGVNPLVKEWMGESIRAVAYDRARTVAPKSPKLTKGGTLSKSVTDFDLSTYLSFAAGEDGAGVPFEGTKKDGTGAGVYTAEQSVIERLSTREARQTWFDRTLAPLNTNVVRAHLEAARDTVDDTMRTRERTHPARNFTAACQWCDFLSICRAQVIGGRDVDFKPEDHGLIRRS